MSNQTWPDFLNAGNSPRAAMWLPMPRLSRRSGMWAGETWRGCPGLLGAQCRPRPAGRIWDKRFVNNTHEYFRKMSTWDLRMLSCDLLGPFFNKIYTKERLYFLLSFLPAKLLPNFYPLNSPFIFLGSKITVDGDCSHEIKKRWLLGRKVMTNLDSILKIRDNT